MAPYIVMGCFAVVAIIIAIILIKAVKGHNELNDNGIEVEGVVIEAISKHRDGSIRWDNKVQYVDIYGQTHVGVLSFSGSDLTGRKVIVKYLPSQYDYVDFVSQELPTSANCEHEWELEFKNFMNTGMDLWMCNKCGKTEKRKP